MKTDSQLKDHVIAELESDVSINAARIGISVDNAIVTVSGMVDSYMQKHATEHAVRRVGGVRGIALDLEVKLSPEHQRGDADIAQAALESLRWHSQVPEDAVKVEVEDGYVTLTGEVDAPYQVASAERCIRPLRGIMGISNRINLRARADAHKIKEEIEQAFARHVQREARHVDVSVQGSVVSLRGTVESMAQHHAALGTARAAHGVTRVVDCLVVEP